MIGPACLEPQGLLARLELLLRFRPGPARAKPHTRLAADAAQRSHRDLDPLEPPEGRALGGATERKTLCGSLLGLAVELLIVLRPDLADVRAWRGVDHVLVALQLGGRGYARLVGVVAPRFEVPPDDH